VFFLETGFHLGFGTVLIEEWEFWLMGFLETSGQRALVWKIWFQRVQKRLWYYDSNTALVRVRTATRHKNSTRTTGTGDLSAKKWQGEVNNHVTPRHILDVVERAATLLHHIERRY
jgi:hypothetical protein